MGRITQPRVGKYAYVKMRQTALLAGQAACYNETNLSKRKIPMARHTTKQKPKPRKKDSMLPLWLVLIGLVIVFIAGYALFGNNAQSQAAVEVKGAPRLKVDKDKIDHGDVKLGTTVTDVVRITNVGDQTLSISEAPYLEVKEGC